MLTAPKRKSAKLVLSSCVPYLCRLLEIGDGCHHRLIRGRVGHNQVITITRCEVAPALEPGCRHQNGRAPVWLAVPCRSGALIASSSPPSTASPGGSVVG